MRRIQQQHRIDFKLKVKKNKNKNKKSYVCLRLLIFVVVPAHILSLKRRNASDRAQSGRK
jgi:hypothetical protein